MPPNRLAADSEQLIVHKFPTGSIGLASVTDVWRYELDRHETLKGSLWQRLKRLCRDAPDTSHPLLQVRVPSGAYLILRAIPSSLQQRYGLRDEEGAVFERSHTEAKACQGKLRFHNGARIRMEELRVGQLIEVLSLAKTHVIPYEWDLQPQ